MSAPESSRSGPASGSPGRRARPQSGPGVRPVTQVSQDRGLDDLDFSSLVGASGPMRQMYEDMARVAGTSTTVLIRGESGTGKELIASSIHYHSSRAKKPFIKVNCAALPETLVESELFGHERGAFTGAESRKKGRFELASGGTIFLDEIGELSPAIQVKLLRVLQEREFERVGGTEPVKVDVRGNETCASWRTPSSARC